MRLASLSGLGQFAAPTSRHASTCGCNQCKSGRKGCCPQNAASNGPINLNVSVNPVNSINSGTQSATASEVRSIIGPDGRRYSAPMTAAAASAPLLPLNSPMEPETPKPVSPIVQEGTLYSVKYLEFY